MSGKPKYMSADDAVKLVRDGDNLFVQGSCSIPELLVAALARRGSELKGVRLYNAIALARRVSPLCDPRYRDAFLVDSFFVSNAVRDWVNAGYATTTPRFFSQAPQLFRDGSIKLDIAFINCSMPTPDGYVSFGISADLTTAAVECARIIIAQINPEVPFCYGDGVIHLSRIDVVVEAVDPLATVSSKPMTHVEEAIASHIAPLIPDGATLQIGVGGIPNAVLAALHDHKHLGLHTEALTDGMLTLIEKGVIDNSCKRLETGRSVGCLALGTRRLYEFMDHNKDIVMRDVAWTNDPFVIAQNPNVISINSCLEVDLTGQVCADSIGQLIYSGVGGQVDFVLGASRSLGGKSFLAMKSTTSKGESKIKPILTPGAGVVTTRFQAQWIVTEHGAVDLRGRDLAQRAKLLISIAAPEAREELDRAARARFGYAYTHWAKL